jgi:FkbM family methyltransferase
MPNQIWKALRNVNRANEIVRCMEETAEWARISAAYLGLSRLQYPFVLRSRRGEQIRIEELTDLKAFWQIFLRRVYHVHSADRIIVDLGANIGLFTLYAARMAPQAKIFSFEPFPATFARLVATVRDHRLESRVTCMNSAVAGSNGTRFMPDAEVPSQRRSVASPASGTGGTEVAATTLEAIFDENHLPRVDLLKIDIEGSEYEVLLSAPPTLLARIGRVAMEYHGDCAPYSKQQLFDHLRRAGFKSLWDTCDKLGYGVTEMIFSE